jgi:hypothetical protein
MVDGLEWEIFHEGQRHGPNGRVVPPGRVVLRIGPAGSDAMEMVVDQSPVEMLSMLGRMAGEVRRG